LNLKIEEVTLAMLKQVQLEKEYRLYGSSTRKLLIHAPPTPNENNTKGITQHPEASNAPIMLPPVKSVSFFIILKIFLYKGII